MNQITILDALNQDEASIRLGEVMFEFDTIISWKSIRYNHLFIERVKLYLKFIIRFVKLNWIERLTYLFTLD